MEDNIQAPSEVASAAIDTVSCADAPSDLAKKFDKFFDNIQEARKEITAYNNAKYDQERIKVLAKHSVKMQGLIEDIYDLMTDMYAGAQ